MPDDLHARATSVATQQPGQPTDRRRGSQDGIGGLSLRVPDGERRRTAEARTVRRFRLGTSDHAE